MASASVDVRQSVSQCRAIASVDNGEFACTAGALNAAIDRAAALSSPTHSLELYDVDKRYTAASATVKRVVRVVLYGQIGTVEFVCKLRTLLHYLFYLLCFVLL